MKLLRGAPGSGKTALVFREFKEALRSGRTDLRIVVPTATLVRHFQHELARDGVVFSPHAVMSLSRFAQERAQQIKPVPDDLLRAIVRDALQRSTLSDFPEFAEVAATEGMTATIVDTILLFENAGATPDKLARIRKLGVHAKAFEKLWRMAGDAARKSGFQLRGDLLRAAAMNPQPVRIWMDGFLNFSPIETELVRALAKTCELTLTLTDSPATDEIRKLALQLGAEDRLLPGASRKPRRTLIQARTLEREADEIARRILALHDRGAAFREIGVALREPGTYLSLLRGAFDRFGIPARFYFSSPLRKHPVAIFLGGLVRGAMNGWEFEETIATLRAHPRWGRTADFDRFDFTVREAMPGRGSAALSGLCTADWLKAEVSECLKIETWAPEKQKPADWLQRLQALAANLYRPATLEAPRNYADIENARSHVAALRAWSGAIDSAVAFWNQDHSQLVSLDEFWGVASAVVEGSIVQPPDDRANVVHVMSTREARQWDVKSLFLCGMTDRDFPKQHPQNLLFPDSEIDRLHSAGIPLRKASDLEREERWLFESLQARATDSLFLSYPEHDAAGKSVQQSRLLLDSEPQPEAARACRPEALLSLTSLGRAGRVDAPLLHAEMARLHQTISLTALEDLAQCRFKFFGGRTLALKGAPDRPGERLQPRVTGSILHVALERWLVDKDRDFVELFEEAFDKACRIQHLPDGYRLEVERIQFRDIARRVSANDLWKADSSEAEVDLSLEFPGGITVRCRVDRIDRFGDDCVIVDYKSSKTANVQKLVASRTRLQGPLYALAAQEKLHLNPVAMVYWAVREDERYGWGRIPNTDIAFAPMPENWTGEARARTIERLTGFLQGDVKAHPEESDQCRWCDFASACRVEVEQQALVMIETAHRA